MKYLNPVTLLPSAIGIDAVPETFERASTLWKAVAISKWPPAYQANVRKMGELVCGQEKAGRS